MMRLIRRLMCLVGLHDMRGERWRQLLICGPWVREGICPRCDQWVWQERPDMPMEYVERR